MSHVQSQTAFQKQHNVFRGYKDLRGASKKRNSQIVVGGKTLA